MPILVQIVLCVLFGYLIGNINPSYIIGRMRGFDIRKKGSGNAGASNAVITMGKAVGVSSAIFDILKATAAYVFATMIFPDVTFAAEVAGAACILGHMFPVVMGFRGGKGLACVGCVALGIDWRFFLLLLLSVILIAIVTNYICSAPIFASIVVPLCYGFFGKEGTGWLLNAENGWWGVVILSVAMLTVLFRHTQNIYRIATGTEMHFNYLWMNAEAKQAEKARVQNNRARLQERLQAKKESRS